MKSMTAVLALLATLSAIPVAAQKIAFIDVEEVILNYKKTREITESLEKKVQQEMESLRQGRRAVQERYAALELEQFDESDPKSLLERLRREKEIVMEEVNLENRDKSQRALREKDIVEHMKKVYAGILKEDEIYTVAERISAVFLTTKSPVGANSRSGVTSEILLKQVVWRDPSLDITDVIIRRLNR
jgi:Skp family chaperone for outer membrane proteins